MHTYKALVSKHGGILSITEEEEEMEEHFKVVAAVPGAAFPDVIFVKSETREEAEAEINGIIKRWLDDNP